MAAGQIDRCRLLVAVGMMSVVGILEAVVVAVVLVAVAADDGRDTLSVADGA